MGDKILENINSKCQQEGKQYNIRWNGNYTQTHTQSRVHNEICEFVFIIIFFFFVRSFGRVLLFLRVLCIGYDDDYCCYSRCLCRLPLNCTILFDSLVSSVFADVVGRWNTMFTPTANSNAFSLVLFRIRNGLARTHQQQFVVRLAVSLTLSIRNTHTQRINKKIWFVIGVGANVQVLVLDSNWCLLLFFLLPN